MDVTPDPQRGERVSFLPIADQARLFLNEREFEITSISTELLEQIRAEARAEGYRAGREDAARDLEAEADDEAQRPGRAEPSELIERWLREAARIARGIGRFDEVEDSSTGAEEAGDG